jgi:hypothetical protein
MLPRSVKTQQDSRRSCRVAVIHRAGRREVNLSGCLAGHTRTRSARGSWLEWATVGAVTSNARQELADLLRGVRGGGSFSTRHAAAVDDLVIDVSGVGPLRLPVSAGQAKELRLVASPARYGKGEQDPCRSAGP